MIVNQDILEKALLGKTMKDMREGKIKIKVE
jgi:hypothetical protein